MSKHSRRHLAQVIAARAGLGCSNPRCRRATSGPHSDPEMMLDIGVAAHTVAVSPGGPRYVAELTPEERQSARNAIWLCNTCHLLIDVAPKKYSPELLHEWKADAERIAVAAMSTFQVASKRVSAGDEEIDLVCKNSVNRPCWLTLHSPLCFVECKNWSS